MASMSFSVAPTLLLLSLNLLFISMVSSSSHVDCSTCGGSTKSPPPPPPPKSTPCPPPPPHKSTPTKPHPPPKSTIPTTTPPPKSTTPTTTPPPKSTTPTTPYPAPSPKSTTPTTSGSCPRDTLKLGVCADLLNGLLNVLVGTPASSPCCSLLNGLTDLEAAVCLCTAIKANVLGINLDVPVSLSLLVNACEKKVPSGFQCT